MTMSSRAHNGSHTVFSLLFFLIVFGSWDGMSPRKGDVVSLYLGSDRLPGAGFSGLHLTRMVVDLPEVQD